MKTQDNIHKKTDGGLIIFSVFVAISLAIGIILIASIVLILGKAI